MLRAHYTIYKLLLFYLRSAKLFLYHQLCISIVDIFESPPTSLRPHTPAALLIGLVAVLTFCVFNNIYLKAQTIGQKCANCSEIALSNKKKKYIEERRKEKI